MAARSCRCAARSKDRTSRCPTGRARRWPRGSRCGWRWPSATPALLTLTGRLHGPGLEGQASFDGALTWVAEPAVFTVDIARASVDTLRMADATTKGRDPLGWKRLEVADTHVDVMRRRV